MDKKVLIISASPQKGGNSDILCDQFMRGAQEAGLIFGGYTMLGIYSKIRP